MKNFFLILGFLLFVFGFLSLILSMIGLQFQFMTWMDKGGRLLGFVLRITMMMFGIAIAYLSRTDWKQEDTLQ